MSEGRFKTVLRGTAEVMYVLLDNPILFVGLILLFAFVKSVIGC